MVSIIVPVLNEERKIAALVDLLKALEGQKEILVVDGQSSDRTAALAESAGAVVIRSGRGRGVQMHAGAQAARGDVLWFVHADSLPSPQSLQSIENAFREGHAVAGNCSLVFGGNSRSARQMTWIYPKLRWLGLSYGDAGIFVRRTAYDAIGGFRDYGLFEDLDLIRRLKPLGPFVHLACPIVTSSRRFEGSKYLGAWTRWITLQLLYWSGVSPHRLARWYPPAN